MSAMVAGSIPTEVIPFEDSVITDVLHPLLDKRGKTKKDEQESENNMVVIVEYKGKKYRVDFSKEPEDYQLLPRALKKEIALEDIRESVDADEQRQIKVENDVKELAKVNPKRYNQMVQSQKRASTIDRLREKLRLINPLKYKDINRDRD